MVLNCEESWRILKGSLKTGEEWSRIGSDPEDVLQTRTDTERIAQNLKEILKLGTNPLESWSNARKPLRILKVSHKTDEEWSKMGNDPEDVLQTQTIPERIAQNLKEILKIGTNPSESWSNARKPLRILKGSLKTDEKWSWRRPPNPKESWKSPCKWERILQQPSESFRIPSGSEWMANPNWWQNPERMLRGEGGQNWVRQPKPEGKRASWCQRTAKESCRTSPVPAEATSSRF